MTKDIARRLTEHNCGKVKSTKGRRPWKVVLLEEAGTRSQATIRERYWKSGAGREKVNKIIQSGEK